MITSNVSFGICVVLVIALMARMGYGMGTENAPQCKELNHVACYAGPNEGYFCSKKDQTKSLTRWFYDKGNCRKLNYKGCYGNRNRFCTKEECERRCAATSAESKAVKSNKLGKNFKNKNYF